MPCNFFRRTPLARDEWLRKSARSVCNGEVPSSSSSPARAMEATTSDCLVNQTRSSTTSHLFFFFFDCLLQQPHARPEAEDRFFRSSAYRFKWLCKTNINKLPGIEMSTRVCVGTHKKTWRRRSKRIRWCGNIRWSDWKQLLTWTWFLKQWKIAATILLILPYFWEIWCKFACKFLFQSCTLFLPLLRRSLSVWTFFECCKFVRVFFFRISPDSSYWYPTYSLLSWSQSFLRRGPQDRWSFTTTQITSGL